MPLRSSSNGPASGVEAATPAGAGRRHDLDALRGFAMLLGIGLHASLAFFPTWWPVEDAKADVHGPYDEFFHAVHGFRMPVFFLLSGFFTAMLWRRRGLGSLLRQRVTRVLIPLVIGAATIVPLMDWVVDESFSSPDIVTAVIIGDAEGVQRFVDGGYELESQGEDGGTILHLAAVLATAEVTEVLLEAGADPEARNFSGDTPLTAAFAFGNEPAADLLVAYGAPDKRPAGVAWRDIDGWGFLAETLEAPADEQAESESWVTSLHHLWFLWFLCLLVVGFVVAVGLSKCVAAIRPGEPRPGITRQATLVALVVATWPGQYLMGEQGAFRVFGPDTSTGLVPEPHVLGYYALFFAFGVVAFDTRGRGGGELADTLGRHWRITLPTTLVIVFPLSLHATFGSDSEGQWAWWAASLLQAAFTWAMILALIGLFRAVLSVERRGVRYLSDSAYWLYLVHLPLVIAGQAWIRDWGVPASVKFVGLCAVTTLILLASYQVFVRYTPIGALLNGRRTRDRSRLPAT